MSAVLEDDKEGRARKKLVKLYAAMYELTEPECRTVCRCPQSCCSAEYCEMTIEIALEMWGVSLSPIPGAKFPLLGKDGCIAAPHLRPLCTLHTCDVANLGFKKGDPQWTKKYFALRHQLKTTEGVLARMKDSTSKGE